MATNEAQRAQWNADHQAKTWPKRERLTTEVTPRLIAELAPQPGERILEIGSGGGLVALEVARAVAPGGSVVGFDISEPLVGLAASRAAERGVENVRFVAGDAQTDDIPGGPFDAVTSQFGVMFFADPTAAFTNIRRHLSPGARLVFACWQGPAQNPWFPMAILAKYAPPPPPAASSGPPPSPFAFADPDYVRGVLEGAGFGNVSCEPAAIDVAVGEETLFDRETLRQFRVAEDRMEAAWGELKELEESLKRDDGLLHLTLAPQIVRAVSGG
jgi:SAM-dependent methyltransferase